jgi:hypothetical protein
MELNFSTGKKGTTPLICIETSVLFKINLSEYVLERLLSV